MAQEKQEVANRIIRNEEIERMQRELDRKKRVMENAVLMLQEKFAREEDEIRILIEQDVAREDELNSSQNEIAALRKAKMPDTGRKLR